MLTEDQLLTLMRDLESDRVERTVAENDTTKACEAICAFANDFPNHRQPGYFLIGVKNDGSPSGLRATDKTLAMLGDLRSNGNIRPSPAMTVGKLSLSDGSGDVIVLEVAPSDLPPVSYKGRVWIRVGPRKAVANEQEERILFERRTILVRSFDARPCPDATLEDLARELFVLNYLPRAVSPDILEENHRPLEHQLASLRFYDSARRCPTHAGIILFGTNPRRFIESDYVQFLRLAGSDENVVNEQRVMGDLAFMLRELEVLVAAHNSQRPFSETMLQERQVRDYPEQALREFVVNAVLHRSYETSSPVRINWFDDRIEIWSPGGLHGEARPENFPEQNSYRNPVLAEALKVLGFVNRFGRGVIQAQRALDRNGNPPAEFRFDPMFVQVTVRRAV